MTPVDPIVTGQDPVIIDDGGSLRVTAHARVNLDGLGTGNGPDWSATISPVGSAEVCYVDVSHAKTTIIAVPLFDTLKISTVGPGGAKTLQFEVNNMLVGGVPKAVLTSKKKMSKSDCARSSQHHSSPGKQHRIDEIEYTVGGVVQRPIAVPDAIVCFVKLAVPF
jgi:hypothetical protein